MYAGPQQKAFATVMTNAFGLPLYKVCSPAIFFNNAVALIARHSQDLNGGTPNCVSFTPDVGVFFPSLNQSDQLTFKHSLLTGMTRTTGPPLPRRISLPSNLSAQIG